MSSIGFSVYDILLLTLCPVAAVIGTFAQIIYLCIDLKGPPKSEDEYRYASPILEEFRGAWMSLRMILGGIVGLVVALYFIGLIHETPANLGRILALAILAGFLTPKLLETHDKIIDKKLNALLKDNNS